MILYLIRHAQAGPRRQDGRDRYRPLAPEGHRRAEELVPLFRDEPVDRLLSSPATRCAQTVGPLERALALPCEEREELWEGSSIDEALALFEGLETDGVGRVVACSHGDMIPAMVDALAGRGVPISGRGCELGSIWVLECEQGRWRSARYLNRKATALA